MRTAFGAALSIVMAFPLFAQRPALSTGPVDISGMWNFATLTPLERPPEFADKYFLTPTEAAEFEAQRRRVGDQVFGVGPAVVVDEELQPPEGCRCSSTRPDPPSQASDRGCAQGWRERPVDPRNGSPSPRLTVSC